ncbi:transcription factor of the MADS box [Dissophora globulifera]|nr:transcription factor of the MADS box [Dissophora globulifera]
MSSKRNQATVLGGAGAKDRGSDEGGDDHIDKKFKQVHGDGDDDDDDDEEDEAPKAGKRAGRRKIKIEYIEDKSRRHITFSKRKSGIMKKAYELSTLTGTQVLLLVVSETGLVYTFTTPKLQPLVTKPEGKNLIQACLHAPDKETTPDDYAGHDQEDSPAPGSEQEREDQSSSPQLSSPQQAPPPMQQQQTPYTSSAAMGMYPPPYNNIPFPQGGAQPPYSYPNMGMGYQGGPPNPGGAPQSHPSSQYWNQQQQQQAANSVPAAQKGGRGDK